MLMLLLLVGFWWPSLHCNPHKPAKDLREVPGHRICFVKLQTLSQHKARHHLADLCTLSVHPTT